MRPTRSAIFHVLLACWTIACASRSLPTSEPRSSAASLEAPEAEPYVVTQALTEDPPLPGPESAGWLGLQAPAAASAGPEHQHSPAPEGPAPAHEHGTRAPHQHGPASAPGRNEAAPSGVRYVCPMHPEVVSSKPGRCPRCGMPLVQRP